MTVTDSLPDRLRTAIDETEAWARAASRAYEYADEGSTVPEEGVHWRWVAGDNWDEVTPDPVTMRFVEGPDRSWSVNLATVEEWPSTMRINDERSRTSMMPRTYATEIVEMDPAAAGHIARHDPAAVLRRCAADRKILDEYDKARTWAQMYRTDPEVNEHQALLRVLRILAEAYGVEA